MWADSAWRSKDIEEKIKEKGLTSRIHRKACRNRPLRDWEKAGNRSRSRFRVRVEHVFGAQHNDMGGTLVRSIQRALCSRDGAHRALRISPTTCDAWLGCSVLGWWVERKRCARGVPDILFDS